MKKLLLILLGILFFAGSFAVEVKEITGPTSVTSGDRCTYKVVFTEKLTVATQFIISIEKDAGLFSNGSSTYYEFISPGKSEIELLITWSPSVEGKIVITGGRGGGLPKTLAVTLNKPNNSLPISGPSIILENTIVTYQVPNEKYYNPLEWIVDTNLLDIISGQGTYKIQVKAKKHIEKTFISVKSKTLGGATYTHSKEIKISPNFAITASERVSCQESEVSYEVTFPEGASVIWTPVERLSYVSGQGTATAKFKTSGNGFAKVKAKVTYQGKEYNLENSNVWIGKPVIMPSDDPYFLMRGDSHSFCADAYGIDETTTYTWIKGSGSFSLSDDGFCALVRATGAIGSFFSFRVIITNKCGTLTRGYGVTIGTEFNERSAKIEDNNQLEIKSVRIYNLSGVLVYSNNAVDEYFDIKSTELTDGIYIIEKFDGQNKTSEKVLLKR